MNFAFKQLFLSAILLFTIITTCTAGNNKDNSPDLQIIGGEDADIKDYPWQVALFGVDENGYITHQMCGGSIIDPYWILTAAHCVQDNAHKTEKIVAHITSLSNPGQGQIIEISDFIVHENFDINILQNDIALLRLSIPIDTSKSGSKVIRVLNPQDELDGLIAPGTIAAITGWGTTTYQGQQSDILQVATLPIISVETANQWFEETNSNAVEVIGSMLPAGYEQGGKSGCHGDSGGPLVVKDNTNTWTLAGITSWGNVCGGVKQPAIYTRVSYFYDWIMSNTKIGNDKVPTESDYVENIRIIIPKQVYSCEDYNNFGDVLIRNLGLNDLTSFEMYVKIGNSPDDIIMTDSSVITLDKKLPALGSKRISLPDILPEVYGKYYIEVSVAKPNTKDVVIEDAAKNTYFNYTGNSPVKVKLNLGQVTQLECQVLDISTFSSIDLGTYFNEDSDKIINLDKCLPPGQYMFYAQGLSEGTVELSIDYEGKNYIFGKGDFSESAQLFFELPFVPEYDLSANISNVLTSDTIYTCDINDFEANIGLIISNNGTLPGENILVRTTVNGTISDSLFTKVLNTRGAIQLALNKDKLKYGENNLKIEIIDYYNKDLDKTPANNVTESKFIIKETEQVATLVMYGDNYNWSKRFHIIDSEGKIVKYHEFKSLYQYDMNLCLPEGCYTFVATDYLNDGMNRDTAVTMKRMDGSIIFAIKGKDYLSGKRVEFCTNTTDVAEDLPSGLNIYPNPADGFIEINLNNEASLIASEVQIFNMLGIEMMTVGTGLDLSTQRIDISNLPSGVYYIKIGDRVEKFVKM